MALVTSENVVCGICGHKSPQPIIGKTELIGLPDLDTRPPEVARSTVAFRVQRCPECGYCAPDISQKDEKASQVIETEDYHTQLWDSDYPEAANSFICAAFICISKGEFADAGWGYMHAAWVCDDEDENDMADQSRRSAIGLFTQCLSDGIGFSRQEERGSDEIIMADLYRRIGEFGQALVYSDLGITKKPIPRVMRVLLFGKALAQGKDNRTYSLLDVPGVVDSV
jgi:hypothetical protein